MKKSVFDISDVMANVLLAATSVAPEATKFECNLGADAKPVAGSELELGSALYCILIRAVQRFHAGAHRKQVLVNVNCARQGQMIRLEISDGSTRSNAKWTGQSDPDLELGRAANSIKAYGGRLSRNVDAAALTGLRVELPCAQC